MGEDTEQQENMDTLEMSQEEQDDIGFSFVYWFICLSVSQSWSVSHGQLVSQKVIQSISQCFSESVNQWRLGHWVRQSFSHKSR